MREVMDAVGSITGKTACPFTSGGRLSRVVCRHRIPRRTQPPGLASGGRGRRVVLVAGLLALTALAPACSHGARPRTIATGSITVISPTAEASAPAAATGASPAASGSPRVVPGREPSPSGLVSAQPPIRAGVYRFAAKGWEEGGKGIHKSRDLPPESRLVVSGWKREAAGWEGLFHRELSSEHYEEGRVFFDAQGDHLRFTKVWVSYGPASRTEQYTPDPPILILSTPLVVGLRWEGTFGGSYQGEYHASVVGREPIVVKGRSFDTWVIEIDTTFRGEWSGSTFNRRWYAPALRMDAKVYTKAESHGMVDTSSERTLTLLDSEPGPLPSA
ncbi:MAG: hypothetical protein WDA71_07180 [Actinomycetota bacterium]